MCFFNSGSSGGDYSAPEATKAENEKNEAAKAKARLLETSGGNKGAELNAGQGKSIRRIFG